MTRRQAGSVRGVGLFVSGLGRQPAQLGLVVAWQGYEVPSRAGRKELVDAAERGSDAHCERICTRDPKGQPHAGISVVFRAPAGGNP